FHHRFFDSLFSQPRHEAVQLARHGGESPPGWFLFWSTRIHHHRHQYLLVYVNPRDLHRLLLSVEAAERAKIKLHTVTCYLPLPCGRSGATQIGSKRAFLIKLKNGLT